MLRLLSPRIRLATILLFIELSYLTQIFLDLANCDIAIHSSLYLYILQKLDLLFHHHKLERFVVDNEVLLVSFVRFLLYVSWIRTDYLFHFYVTIKRLATLVILAFAIIGLNLLRISVIVAAHRVTDFWFGIIHKLLSIVLRWIKIDTAFTLIDQFLEIHPNFCADNHLESSAYILFASDVNLASHFFYNELANTETETSSLWIYLLVLIQFHEVHEDILDFILWNSYTWVFDFNSKLSVSVNIVIRNVIIKLYGQVVVIGNTTIFPLYTLISYLIRVRIRLFQLILGFFPLWNLLDFKQFDSDNNILVIVGEFDCIW